MTGIREGALYNVVEEGIKEDIRVALASDRLRAAVMLIYAGMDAMAYLDMPANQEEVTSIDFIRWADRYIRFPCKEQISGEDLYGARCALLHSYGIVSRRSRQGRCRQVGYLDKAVPEIQYNAGIDPNLVLVSIDGLKTAFFEGINQFLVDAYADKQKAAVVDPRLNNMIHAFPVKG